MQRTALRTRSCVPARPRPKDEANLQAVLLEPQGFAAPLPERISEAYPRRLARRQRLGLCSLSEPNCSSVGKAVVSQVGTPDQPDSTIVGVAGGDSRPPDQLSSMNEAIPGLGLAKTKVFCRLSSGAPGASLDLETFGPVTYSGGRPLGTPCPSSRAVFWGGFTGLPNTILPISDVSPA